MHAALTTFMLADARARNTVADILLARTGATLARREVAIKQHSTLTWLDTYEAAAAVYTSDVLHDNYLRTARSFARREMQAIDSMHADLRRLDAALGV